MKRLSILTLLAFALAISSVLAADVATTTVVLVRHAEKVAEGNDPDLTPAGRERAAALAEAVAHLDLKAVIVTDTKRTMQTGEPAAKARGLTPVVVPTSGGAPAHVKAVVEAIRAVPAGGSVLVVGHSNTVPLIIQALGGPTLAALCDTEFASMFVLEIPPGSATPRMLRARYGAADPPGASECKP